MKKEITIKLNKDTDISSAVNKAMKNSDKKYKTIKPSQQLTTKSTQEGTLNAVIGTARHTAG